MKEDETYGRVTERALGNGLEQSRLSDVGQTDDAALEVVSRTAEEDLFLGSGLLWRHFLLGRKGTVGGETRRKASDTDAQTNCWAKED